MKKQTTRIFVQAIVILVCILIGMLIGGLIVLHEPHRPSAIISFCIGGLVAVIFAIIGIKMQGKDHHDKNTGEENQ